MVNRLIHRLHLLLGLCSGLVVFIVAITGAIYAFEPQLRRMAYKSFYTVTDSDKPVLPADSLLSIAKKYSPGMAVKSLIYSGRPGQSVEIGFKNKSSVFINPYTGVVLGSILNEKNFFGIVLHLHRDLLLGDVGKYITGISALVFLFMLLSGIFLWWPANRRFLKQKLSLKRKVSFKKLVYDAHQVLGFYAAWFLIVSAFTGLIWSFKWFEKGVYFLSNSKLEPKTQLYSDSTKNTGKLSVEDMVNTAKHIFAGAEKYYVYLPETKNEALRVTVDMGNGQLLRELNHVYFDVYKAEVLKVKRHSEASAGEKIKMNNKNLHTGQMFGIAGQLIMFFAALIAALLPVTGFLIWRNKKLINP